MKKKLIITIDGPAGTGKSTVARMLAGRINAAFLDTGAMYRAVTLCCIQNGVDPSDTQKVLPLMENTEFNFLPEQNGLQVYINSRDCTEKLRSDEVTENSKYIASAAPVREKLVHMQRQFAKEQNKIVTEGRDQGTAAFPEADHKFFLTADTEQRVKRRYSELVSKGLNPDYDQLKEAIIKRDYNDKNRKTSPLKPASDAVHIDTTKINAEQVVSELMEYLKDG